MAQADIGGNHGTIPYAADRWILDSGTVSYEAGVGLTLNGTIRQKLEFPPTGETSAFVGMASGAASISCADGEVTITSSGGVLKWAALYSGVYTAATMPEYQPKGYGAELAECQRYYLPISKSNGASGINAFPAHAITTSLAVTCIPVTMRVNPTVTINNCYLRKGITDIVIDSVNSANVRGCFVEVTFKSSGLTQGENYILRLNTGTMQLSADL